MEISAKLLERAKGGDQNAIEEICSVFSPVIRRLPHTYFLLGGESGDVMQEATLGLVFAIRDFDAGKGVPFEAFARKCIYRKVLTAVRIANAEKHLPLNTADTLDFAGRELVGADTDPMELLLREEWHKHFWHIVDTRLSKTEAQAVRLYTEGYSYAQIALKLNKTPKVIDNALSRARKKLENSFEKH